MTDRTVNVKLLADVAQYMASMRAAGSSTNDLEKAARDVRKAHLDQEAAAGRVAVAQAKLNDVEKDGTASSGKLAAAQEQLAKAHRDLKVAQDDSTTATERFQKAQNSAENSASESAQKVQSSFSALSFAALAVGLPAAAAAGAAGAGLALGAVPLLFGAIGTAALISDQEVSAAFVGLATHVKSSTLEMAQPLKGDLIDAVGQVGTTFDSLSPVISRSMSDSRGSILQLTGAVDDFAIGAMPGMLVAVDASKGPLDGLRSLAGQTGAGLTDMFVNLAAGSQGADQGLTDLGGIVRNLEGFIGTLLANLANGSHAVLPAFSGSLSQVETIVADLTSGGGGMPALQGAASGFLGTVSGGLAIVQGFVSALGGWAGPLGQATGALGATNSMAKIFGTSIGATGFGLGAFTTQVDAAGKSTTPFKSAVSGATGVTDKLKAGVGAVASSGFNPLGLALIGGGLLLDIWGKHAQEAAQRAAENKQIVDDLTQAYIKDGEAVGANVQASAGKTAADKNLANNAAAAGISQATWTSALVGDTESRKEATQTVLDHGKAIIFAGNGTEMAKQQMYDEYVQIVQNGGSISDLTSKYDAFRDKQNKLTDAQKQGLEVNGNAGQVINQIAGDLEKAAQSSVDLTTAQDKVASQVSRATTPAMYAASVASGQLTAAFSALNVAGGDVVSKGGDLIAVLRTLAGEKPSVEEALNTWNSDLRTINDTLKGDNLKGHTKDLIDNTGAVNTATKAGGDLYQVTLKQANDFAAYGQSLKDSGASADEMTTKLGDMRGAFIKQMETMGLTATQAGELADHYGLIPDKIVTELSLEGDKETQAQLTDITTKLSEIPAGKSVSVNALTDNAILALGDLGDKIVKMPDGTFQVFANTAPGKAAADQLLQQVGTSDATTTVYANTAPAGQAVSDWAHTTSTVNGNTTTFTDINPATGAVRTWQVTTDSTGAKTTTYTNADPAAGAVGTWKRNTDGTWGQVNVFANVGQANAAIDNAARDRTANIYVQIANSAALAKANALANDPRGGAHGGIVGYANGGITGYASGGLRDLTPMSSIASVVDPNTWRVIGDNMTSKESYIPWDGSARSKEILAQTNAAFGYDNTNSVRQAIQSGTAVVQTAGVGSSSSGGGGGVPDIEAHFYVGDQELKGLVRTEIRAKDRSTKRAVTAGAGGSR